MLHYQKHPYVGRILKKSLQRSIHAQFYIAIKGPFGKLCHSTDSHTWWGNYFFLEKELKLRFLNILKFSLFSFFRFKRLFLSKFSTVENDNWSQMFTYGPYYPLLAITPFWPNGSFTYEMPHIQKFKGRCEENMRRIVSCYLESQFLLFFF